MAMDHHHQAANGGWNYFFSDAPNRHYFTSGSSTINTSSAPEFQLSELFSSDAAAIESSLDDVFPSDDIFGLLAAPSTEPPKLDNKATNRPVEAPFSTIPPPPPRLRRSVADELKSLSLDQFVNAAAHKRASFSPLASPKKQAHKAEASSPPLAVVESKSKEGAAAAAAAKTTNLLLQRSLSSHDLGQLPPASAFDSAMQGLASVPSLSQLLLSSSSSTSSSSSSSQMKPSSSSSELSIRRVCSTGDIQQKMNPESHDELGFKIGRYNLAERKERIHRYRQKRSERNFNKKIKYACRKTLADSRPRVRGRFARNEDVVSTRPNVFPDDEVEALLEEDEAGFLIDRQSSGEHWDLS